MKRISALVLLAATLFAPVSLQAGENIFPEGGFERAGKGGGPDGWTVGDKSYLAKLGASITVERKGGERFLRITNNNITQTPHCTAIIDLPEKTRSVRISYRMRGENIVVADQPTWAGGFLGGGFLGVEGGFSQDIIPSKRIRKDVDGWLEVSNTYDVPSEAFRLQLQPGLYYATGTFDIDDIQVEIR